MVLQSTLVGQETWSGRLPYDVRWYIRGQGTNLCNPFPLRIPHWPYEMGSGWIQRHQLFVQECHPGGVTCREVVAAPLLLRDLVPSWLLGWDPTGQMLMKAWEVWGGVGWYGESWACFCLRPGTSEHTRPWLSVLMSWAKLPFHTPESMTVHTYCLLCVLLVSSLSQSRLGFSRKRFQSVTPSPNKGDLKGQRAPYKRGIVSVYYHSRTIPFPIKS